MSPFHCEMLRRDFLFSFFCLLVGWFHSIINSQLERDDWISSLKYQKRKSAGIYPLVFEALVYLLLRLLLQEEEEVSLLSNYVRKVSK
jgi:hypothetical protein